MPNSIDSSGLTVKTLTEIVNDLTTGMQTIYGSDINVESSSPDGQMINLFAQAAIDNLEVLADAYNVLNPEAAYGAALDNVVSFSGITRTGATYTTAPVSITTDRALTLNGQDALIADPAAIVYSVKDDTGNLFELVTTKVFAVAGTDSLTFKAQAPGAVLVAPNTITEQNTSILGVTAVNNPTVSGLSQGLDEETDAALKIRRAKMYKLPALGPADAVRAAILDVVGVVDAIVVENDTAGTVDSVPAHSIYAIVNPGSDASLATDIATAIYTKKSAGCGMYGAVTKSLTRVNGETVTMKWGAAVAQDLYIQFSILPKHPADTFDEVYIKDQLAAALTYKLGDNPTIGDIIIAMATIAPNAIVSSPGVSRTAGSYTDVITPTAAVNYFTVSAANIDIP